MKRRDSILAKYYYSKLPKKQLGGQDSLDMGEFSPLRQQMTYGGPLNAYFSGKFELGPYNAKYGGVPKYQKAGQYAWQQPIAPAASESTSLVRNTPNGPVSTATTGQTKQQIEASSKAMAKARKAEEEEKKRRIAERKSAVAARDKGASFTFPTGETKKYEDMDAREKMYVSGKALGQRSRFNENDEAWYDTWLNPLNLVGSMGEALGAAPYEAKQTDSYMPYATSIGMPLLMGRMMGSGSINPLGKKFWTNEVSNKEFLNAAGMGIPGLVGKIPGVKQFMKSGFTPTQKVISSQPEILGVQQGMDAVNAKIPGYNAHLFEHGENVVDKELAPELMPFLTERPEPWSLKGTYGGLQVKSTMKGSPLERQLSKTGQIDINSIRSHIGKADVGAQDKYVIDKVLNEKFAGQKKIDYNQFRKAVSDELIPLNATEVPDFQYTNWGLDKLGYTGVKQKNVDLALTNTKAQIDLLEEQVKGLQNVRNTLTGEQDIAKADSELKAAMDELASTKNHYAKVQSLLEGAPLENKTITFSNTEKFGTGDTRHFQDPATLGHTRFLVSREEPKVSHVLESQSDFFQNEGKTTLEKLKKIKESQPDRFTKRVDRLNRLDSELETGWKALDDLKFRFKNGMPDQWGNPIHESQIAEFEYTLNQKAGAHKLTKAEVENWEQKSHLGKAHQERFLQENMKHAAQNGQTKMRYPTSETAAKIQGYEKQSNITSLLGSQQDISKLPEELQTLIKNVKNASRDSYDESYKTLENYLKDNKLDFYNPEHQTILKKYSEAPKMVKKVVGKEPKLVTDSKGNTWYEFDIPEEYSTGTYEMRAFAKGGMIEDNRGQWAHPGKNTRISSPNITMQGVPYPVLAKANNGQQVMMQPGQDYYFPGADYVDEYPMMKRGGWLDKFQDAGEFDPMLQSETRQEYMDQNTPMSYSNDNTQVARNNTSSNSQQTTPDNKTEEYSGPSIVDYLATKGYKGTKNFRKELASKYGITDYDFSAAKNTELMNAIKADKSPLNSYDQNITPVSTQQLNDYYNSRVSSQTSKPKYVNKDNVNAMLNLSMMRFDPNKSKARTTGSTNFGITGSMRPTYSFKSKSKPAEAAPVKPATKQPVAQPAAQQTWTKEQNDEFLRSVSPFGTPMTSLPAPTTNTQLKGFDDKNVFTSRRQRPVKPVAKPQAPPVQQEEPSFWDGISRSIDNFEDYLAATVGEGVQTVNEAYNTAKDYGNMGINYLKRKYDLLTGDDEDTKSSVRMNTQPTVVRKLGNEEEVIDNTPAVTTGNKILDSDRGDRFYHVPEIINLDKVKFGYRNRGEAGSTADKSGTTTAEGLIITPFATEYSGNKKSDNIGKSTIRTYKDSEIADNQLYGGVDDQGKFILDFGKNLKGKNLKMADFRYTDVTGFAKDKNGKIIMGNETSNKGFAHVPHLKTVDGKERPLNFLVPKNGNNQDQTFGKTTGGRMILATPDMKTKILVSGSLKNVDEALEDFKKKYKTDKVRVVFLDNGTYSRGLRTKDKKISKQDFINYDINDEGGAGFYYYQDGGDVSIPNLMSPVSTYKTGGWLDNYK